MRVLLVDDDTNLLKILSDILNAKGMETVSAETGADALVCFDGQEIDVVLIDLKLNGSSGLDVMRSIKARSADTECILLTGYASQASAIEAVNLGAFAYFQKPYNIEQLLLAVKRAGERRATEKALRTSEHTQRVILDNIDEIVYSTEQVSPNSSHGILTFVSNRTPHILGFEADELLEGPNSWYNLVHSEDVPALHAHTSAIFSTRQAGRREYRVRHKTSGEYRWMEDLVVPKLDGDGNVIGTFGVVRDVTEQKQASEALRESEERFRSWLENSSDLVTVLGLDGKIQYASPSYETLLGYSPDALIGTSGFDLLHPDDKDHIFELFANSVQKPGTKALVEFRFRHADGSWRMVEALGKSYVDANGQAVALVNARDITERRRMEERLRRSEAGLAEAQRIAHVGSWDWIAKTDTPSWSRELCHIMEVDPDKPVPNVAAQHDLYTPDSMVRMNSAIETTMQSGQPYEIELERVRKDGSRRWLQARGERWFDDDGELIGLRGTALDITERKQAEEALRQRLVELEALYAVSSAMRTVMTKEEALPIVLDATLAALNAGAGAIGLFDAANNQLLSAVRRGWFEQIDIGPMQSDDGIGGKVVHSRQTYISEEFCTDPHTRSSERLNVPPGWGGACIPILSADAIIGVMYVSLPHPQRILPEQVKLLESLAELAGITLRRISLIDETKSLLHQTQAQAQHTQQIIDTIPEGVLVVDSRGGFVQANPLALAYLPKLAELAVGDPVTCLPGQLVTAGLHSVDPQHPWHELSWGQPPRLYESAAQPLGNPQQPEGWVLILRDVTDERERQRYQKVQENLASVGQMAAGIAHDFNNILGAIILYVNLLRNGTGLSAKQQAYLTDIHTQSQHAAALVRQILDFGRRAMMEKVALDLLPLVKESIRLLERTLPENVRLHLAYDRNDYVIFGDPTRLQQMLVNLAINARDAMPNGGNLTLTLSSLTVAPGDPLPVPDMTPGSWVRLDVADMGTGIDPKYLSHLFQPFFTTKEVGKGTGLGLAQVYGIVKQHQGAITVESQVGGGTSFSIYLPLFESAPVEGQPVKDAASVAGGGETLLLVEDNEVLRVVVEQSLQALGYVVHAAADGDEALAILAQGPGTIALLISDLVMPRMGGFELAKTVQRNHPGIKTLIMTGHPLTQTKEALREAGVVGFIPKPFVIEDLAEQIRAALDHA